MYTFQRECVHRPEKEDVYCCSPTVSTRMVEEE